MAFPTAPVSTSERESSKDPSLPRHGQRTGSILRYGNQLAARSRHLEALHAREAPNDRLLEQGLRAKRIDGIIALHTDDTSEWIYGYVNGNTLTRHLLKPSRRAAASFLPRDDRPEIPIPPSPQSSRGITRGSSSAPQDQYPKPFEIVFETPYRALFSRQVEAYLAVLKEILRLFPQIRSQGVDI